MTTWKLESAKARLSELVRSAQEDGPQQITVRGQPKAVVLSVDAYRRLTQPEAESWVDRLHAAAGGVDLVFERDSDSGREIEL